MKKILCLFLALLPVIPAPARQPADTLQTVADTLRKALPPKEKEEVSVPREPGQERHLTIGASMWSRGEFRDGALPAENGVDHALFLMSNNVLRFDYSQKNLEARIAPKFFGIWGAKAAGSLAIDEAWFGLKHKGLFMRLGRQKLSYDDERIIGSNDWSMATNTHDLVKAGYDGEKHKVHLLVAYNQNNENTNGGTYYVNGGQVYKNMQAIWYHWDIVKQLGASLIFMNMGMQKVDTDASVNKTEFQQIFGIYADWHPKKFGLQASYYRQTGKDENSLPIHAWMTSVEAKGQLGQMFTLNGGYFYMSGDENFFVPAHGALGLIRKTEVRGFNPMFGSHHQFYGAMDFFYVTTYYGGNTPGLQDLHLGAKFTPVKGLNFSGTFHLLATSVPIVNASTRILGQEVEIEASWAILPNVNLMAGYSFMHGSETMQLLKRSNTDKHLHWAWLMLIATPQFLNRTW